MKSATQLVDASAAVLSVANEAELMEWHDAWMSSDEYTAMSDNDAAALEALFQEQSLQFSDHAAKVVADSFISTAGPLRRSL